jgi:ubiquinone biosynthesis protein UbiJ
MPYRQLAEAVLAEWRLAERRLAEVAPESDEAASLRLEVERLRDSYQRLIEEAHAAHLPEPPPLPERA